MRTPPLIHKLPQENGDALYIHTSILSLKKGWLHTQRFICLFVFLPAVIHLTSLIGPVCPMPSLRTAPNENEQDTAQNLIPQQSLAPNYHTIKVPYSDNIVIATTENTARVRQNAWQHNRQYRDLFWRVGSTGISHTWGWFPLLRISKVYIENSNKVLEHIWFPLPKNQQLIIILTYNCAISISYITTHSALVCKVISNVNAMQLAINCWKCNACFGLEYYFGKLIMHSTNMHS